MHSALIFRVLFLLTAIVGGTAIVRAEDLNAVKARMNERQGALDALKEKKVLGENNRGFVEARGALTPGDEKTVSDENADRRTVYAALATQTGTSADNVGRQRAQQLALRSKSGVWIQDAGGEWKQKS